MADGTQNVASHEVVTNKKSMRGLMAAHFGNAAKPEK